MKNVKEKTTTTLDKKVIIIYTLFIKLNSSQIMEENNTQTSQKSEQIIKKRGLFPRRSLEDVLQVSKAIQDTNAGRPMNRVLLAQAVGRTPSSSEYKMLLSASYQYGLTLGTEKSSEVSLTNRGIAITKPTTSQERLEAIRASILTPPVFKSVFEHYKNAKLPSGELFKNALERNFGIPSEDTATFIKILMANGKFSKMLKEVSGVHYVIIEPVEKEEASEENISEENKGDEEDVETTDKPKEPPQDRSKPQNIFVAHGKDKGPLEELKRVLDQFKIPYSIAVEEPNKALPISEKIAGLMQECSAGIFIFTGDEKLVDDKGEEIYRPSENVIYELGAASILYGNKIVIFKEDGVTFPSDFSGIGYISFTKEGLSSKTAELLKELIEFNLIKITV